MALLGQLVHLDTAQQLQLILGEVQRLARLGVGETCPALGDLNGIQQCIESLAGGRAHDLLAVDVVADVGVGIVERQRDVADGVLGLLGVRVVRVVHGVDLRVFVAFVAIGIGDDAIVEVLGIVIAGDLPIGGSARLAFRGEVLLAFRRDLVAQDILLVLVLGIAAVVIEAIYLAVRNGALVVEVFIVIVGAGQDSLQRRVVELIVGQLRLVDRALALLETLLGRHCDLFKEIDRL